MNSTAKKNSITKRWIRGSLFIMLAIVLVAEGIFLFYMIQGYYNNADLAIQTQFGTLEKNLSPYLASSSSEEQSRNLIAAVEQFEYKANYELMMVDAAGNVMLTSSGVVPREGGEMPDVEQALSYGAGNGKFVGRSEAGEKIMAITKLTPYSSGGIVAMRLVTSLTKVDAAIGNIAIVTIVFLLIIILASVISGLYFIRSIVMPLRGVEATASRIARGDFDTRIDNDSNDEIGSLCKTINHMAKELGHTEAMKNEFISSVSHELRTPLTSIKGWAETVGRLEDTDDPSFRRGMQIISGEADRLYEMVEELLDFSRMQGGMELKLELLDLAAEVEDAALLARQQAANLGIEMVWETPELPVAVRADKNRVRQVLLNVLDNAIKYSSKSGAINIDVACRGHDAVVVVTDEGRGISPEDLENVKIKFYKGKGATRGSGIGLAVVDGIMASHGGTLTVESELGKGTKVTLRFPLDKESML